MTLYITDANIFIDLIYSDLLDSLTRLDLKLATTSLILDELDPPQQKELLLLEESGKLIVYEVDIGDIYRLALPAGLSLPDKSVIFLAIRENGSLLSGDGLVRKSAVSRGLNVYGLLWVFDELVTAKIIDPGTAATKLLFLIEEKGSRQPPSECNLRLEKWKRM